MLSKKIDLSKNQQGLSTYGYYTKEQPVSQVNSYIDSEQNVQFRVQTMSQPINLSESTFCMEIQTPSGNNPGDNVQIIYDALKGVFQSLQLKTGTGQKLYWVERHLHILCQMLAMYDKQTYEKQANNTYEGESFIGFTSAQDIDIYNEGGVRNSDNLNNFGYEKLKRAGLQISPGPQANNVRKLFIQIPLFKLGGIFSKDQGYISFVDDILYFDFKLLPKSQVFAQATFAANADPVTAAYGQNLTINQMYLNICRSKDYKINDSLVQQVQSGVQIPYIFISAKYDTNNSTTVQINHPLTQNEGKKIKEIITCFVDNDQTLGDFAGDNTKNLSGFLRKTLSTTALQRQIMFNNETILNEHAYLASNDKVDFQSVLGRYHCKLVLGDEDILDSGFELSNLPSTNYSLYHTFGQTLQNSFSTTFIMGVNYIVMNANSIKTE